MPRPRSIASSKNLPTQLRKDPVIAGYFHNVSPVKKVLKDLNTSHLQSKRRKKKFCAFHQKNKVNSVTKVERLPSKLTKFSFDETKDNVIWMNTATKINDALEATVDLCYEPNNNETPGLNIKDLDDIQVYQSITVRHMVLFGDNKAEPLSITKLIL